MIYGFLAAYIRWCKQTWRFSNEAQYSINKIAQIIQQLSV